MQLTSSALLGATALLLTSLPCALAQRMYTKSSPVLQVDAKSWDKKIVNAHLPSVVEFYAPWCGHCQNLKPAYEKAASSLSGIVQIAAVNCDDDANKGLCGQLGIQGFPTIKTVRPAALLGASKDSSASSGKGKAKKGKKPAIVDYKGPRSAKDIIETAKALLPNLVSRVTDGELTSWLSAENDTAKALLFSDKGTTSALLKSLALDFRGSLSIAQVRGDREDAITEMFGIETYPALVVLPGGSQSAVTYDGEMKKAALFTFLSKYAEPVSAGAGATQQSKEDTKTKSKKSASKAAPKAAAASETLEEDVAAESPQPIVEGAAKPAPVPVKAPPPLATLATPEELAAKCLGAKTGTCVLALPQTSDADATDLTPAATEAIKALTELSAKVHATNAHSFPFYVVTPDAARELSRGLGLDESGDALSLLAVNAKRGWVRRYSGDGGFDLQALQTWVDGVKLGDVKKESLPDGLIKSESETEGKTKTEAEGVKDEL